MNFRVPNIKNEKTLIKFFNDSDKKYVSVFCWLAEFQESYKHTLKEYILDNDFKEICDHFNFMLDMVIFGNHDLRSLRKLNPTSDSLKKNIKFVTDLINKRKWKKFILYKKTSEVLDFKIPIMSIMFENNITGYDFTPCKLALLEQEQDLTKKFLTGVLLWTMFE
ncbi:hypothetical protein [Salmon gill poxvirus]|uniref:Uncharacterized protein n=1 Tax=Salmon gill poxvirus TaxID=1680908 RepID=A0A0H4XWR8_9POXV|nr:hypothetical protein AL387_gp152 [Salmon gill poxvirus]AKR04276.1 hypothetical protein SGPV152 [Salmon gill poxvirus]WMX26557.1 hypothetical protein [Salmon gill poxvirus]